MKRVSQEGVYESIEGPGRSLSFWMYEKYHQIYRFYIIHNALCTYTHIMCMCVYIYCIHMHIYIAYICILWFVWPLIWRLWLLLCPVLCQDLESKPPLSDCKKLVILRGNEGNKQDTSSHAETTGSGHPSGHRAIRSVPLAISVFNPCVGTVHAPDWWFCFTPVNSLLRFHLFL